MRLVNLTLRVPFNVVQAIEARAEVMGKSKAHVVVARLLHPTEPPLSFKSSPSISQLHSVASEVALLQPSGSDGKIMLLRAQRQRIRQASAQTRCDSSKLVAQSKQLVAQAEILLHQSKQRFNCPGARAK